MGREVIYALLLGWRGLGADRSAGCAAVTVVRKFAPCEVRMLHVGHGEATLMVFPGYRMPDAATGGVTATSWAACLRVTWSRTA